MKKIFYIGVCLFVVGICQAQNLSTFSRMLKSNNQQLIEDAVKDGLYLFETSYQFEDSTKQRFGADDKPFFNRLTFVGFALNGGVAVPQQVFKPWEGDELAEPYLELYNPVLYEVKVRAWQDSVLHPIDSFAITDKVKLWEEYGAVLKKKFIGLDVDTTAGEKDGWMVMVINPENPQLQCTRKELRIDSIGEQRVDAPSSVQEVLGGIYVQPVVERVGRINFRICGVLMPMKKGNRLTIVHPFVGKDYNKELNKAHVGKLQPVKNETKVYKSKDVKSKK